MALKAPVELEPEVERAPLQPPEAVQPVALLDDQFSVAAAPLATLLGVAVSVTVGAGVLAPNTIDFSCQPSLPPLLMLHASTLPPPAAPKQIPTCSELPINDLVVQRAPWHSEMSFMPGVALRQVTTLSVAVTADGFLIDH